MEQIVQSVVEWARAVFGNDYLAVMVVSMLPMIEVKGAIPIAVGMGLNPWVACMFSVASSFIVCPIILLFLRPILDLLKKNKHFNGFAVRVEQIFQKKADKANKGRNNSESSAELIQTDCNINRQNETILSPSVTERVVESSYSEFTPKTATLPKSSTLKYRADDFSLSKSSTMKCRTVGNAQSSGRITSTQNTNIKSKTAQNSLVDNTQNSILITTAQGKTTQNSTSANGTNSHLISINQDSFAQKSSNRSRLLKMVCVFLFVAIPLPLTGVWTGSGVAVFLTEKFRYSIPPVLLGNLIEGLFITTLTVLFGVQVAAIMLIVVSAFVVISIFSVCLAIFAKTPAKK